MSETQEDIDSQLPAARDDRRSLYETMSLERTGGGARLLPQNFSELLALAKLMAMSDIAVPPHLRDNAGACFAVAMQAVRWDMDPFAVASKSYLVKSAKNPEPKIAYEAAVLAAVVHTRANLAKRPEAEYTGEGPERTCKITFTFSNGDVRTYTSPQFKDIKTKNSPLWFDDPDQQFYYYSIRACARKWTPEVLLGVYDRDEIEGAEPMRNITPEEPRAKPNLLEKMGKGTDGFSRDHVDREMNGGPKTQHLIEEHASEVVPMVPRMPEREVEPIRTGENIPGETLGAVRADAKGVSDKSHRKGKKVDAKSEDDGAKGEVDVAQERRGEDAMVVGQAVGGDAPQVGTEPDKQVSVEGMPTQGQTDSAQGESDTELLSKLNATLAPMTAEKGMRTRWAIEFEERFKGRPEAVRKAADVILSANADRVHARVTPEECVAQCERAIARVATKGDLFEGE